MEYLTIHDEKEVQLRPIVSFKYINDIKYKFELLGCCTAFWNCQSSTIGGIEDLITGVKSSTKFNGIIREIAEYFDTPLIVIDIHQDLLPCLKKKIDMTIIGELPYTSSNESEMCIVIIDTQ